MDSIVSQFVSMWSFTHLFDILSQPASWGKIFSLVILEGLLSADNALVLAVMVQHLPQNQQQKALLYGILGAYFFRFVAIALGTTLIKFALIKAIGALYLIYLALHHFVTSDEDGVSNNPRSFWGTVCMVEIMDLAFSFDSILAALGVSSEAWVLYLGGILGILMMRGVAQVFINLIQKYPQLGNTAYLLILVIGCKMGVSVFGVHVPDSYFFGMMALTFALGFVFGKPKAQ